MKIVFLASAAPDLRWFKYYYLKVFPEGRVKADNHFLTTKKTLAANPFAGHASENIEDAREYHILRTPFTFVYHVKPDRIEVLRVLDMRGDWGGEQN